MDLSEIYKNFVFVVFVACLVVGYIIKSATFCKKIPNGNIPVILAVFGAVLNIFVSGPSIDSVVFGAVMGLASTGCHQIFKNFIENSDKFIAGNGSDLGTNDKK